MSVHDDTFVGVFDAEFVETDAVHIRFSADSHEDIVRFDCFTLSCPEDVFVTAFFDRADVSPEDKIRALRLHLFHDFLRIFLRIHLERGVGHVDNVDLFAECQTQ